LNVGENSTDPAFSRDGHKLAYSQFFKDANIWRLDVTGATPPKKLIASSQYDSSPQYSPDGTKIAFRSNRSSNNEVWISDNEGRLPTQLTHSGGPLSGTPRWSPDSKEIAYDSRPEGQPDIYVLPAAGGGTPRRITFSPAEDVVPSWSRDGKWIYFASNRSGAWQVWRAPSSGGNEEQVTRMGGFAAFESPDGRYLYYAKSRGAPGLWRKHLPDGDEEPVLDLKAGYWGYWAVVRDGIYYADQQEGQPVGIYFYPFKDGRIRQLHILDKPPAVADSAFAVSADGRYILFTQIDQAGSDIEVMDHYRPE
jgi:Tol biopolymer transport system component